MKRVTVRKSLITLHKTSKSTNKDKDMVATTTGKGTRPAIVAKEVEAAGAATAVKEVAAEAAEAAAAIAVAAVAVAGVSTVTLLPF
jgi:hypothetical protein